MSKQKTILVVEDDPQGRDDLVHLLRNAGYEVEEAANGRAALDKLQTFSPDLVLSDVLMPEMDGLELLHRLRSGPSVTLANVPVIFYSASRRTLETQEPAIEDETSQRVLKPGGPQAILAAIKNALTQAGPIRPFDSTLFPEEQVRALSEQLVDKVQELTRTKYRLEATSELLQKSEEQYRLLFEGNPNPMWVFDQHALERATARRAAARASAWWASRRGQNPVGLAVVWGTLGANLVLIDRGMPFSERIWPRAAASAGRIMRRAVARTNAFSTASRGTPRWCSWAASFRSGRRTTPAVPGVDR
jgi:CheY-like chemotaxis protein